jgi:16S rRNA (cytidine1402-2'-O)-methyltransferase
LSNLFSIIQWRFAVAQQGEQLSAQDKSTQIFIETPYRSVGMLEALLHSLSPSTLLSVAADLTLPTQFLRTLPAAQWKVLKELPDLQRRPAVFLLQSP